MTPSDFLLQYCQLYGRYVGREEGKPVAHLGRLGRYEIIWTEEPFEGLVNYAGDWMHECNGSPGNMRTFLAHLMKQVQLMVGDVEVVMSWCVNMAVAGEKDGVTPGNYVFGDELPIPSLHVRYHRSLFGLASTYINHDLSNPTLLSLYCEKLMGENVPLEDYLLDHVPGLREEVERSGR